MGGNYWDNYTGTDDDGDGIGDVEHNMSFGEVDYLPLVEFRWFNVTRIECEINTSSNWLGCGNITYGSTLLAVRVNCTSTYSLDTSNASFKLTNVEDSADFFDAYATYNISKAWHYNNTDFRHMAVAGNMHRQRISH